MLLIRIECPDPTLTSAMVAVSNPPYYVDKTVTFTCNSGFLINDTSLASPVNTMVATCNSNAGWDFQNQAQCTRTSEKLKYNSRLSFNLNIASNTHYTVISVQIY